MKISTMLLYCLLVNVTALSRQVQDTNNVKTMIPGKEYSAGWIHRMLYGSNWRDLWSTPIKAPVLDLSRYAGGLRPKKTGGGKQTKSLRLAGADGKEYKFRSIDKDARKSLPQDLQQSIAGDFLQDQISSQNPMSSIIIPPLLSAVGVLNEEPQVVVMPDDERLGDFRQEFGGMLGTIEENPKEQDGEEDTFEGADKFLSTFDLLHRLEDDYHERVDTREYLKARLMDMLIGDWDRHADQWKWAGYRQDGKWIWKPIPRDRDWAFARFGGLIPNIAEETVPELKGFGEDYPDIDGLTWKGRQLDHYLLASVEKPQWDSITAFVQNKLTDEVIEKAVRHLPQEMYDKEGLFLEHALKLRRTKLNEASEELYHLCTSFPDIRGSNKNDVAEIEYINEHDVKVSLYPRNPDSGEKAGPPYFEKVYSENETKDLRVYLLGGNDLGIVKGDGHSRITTRVIGGDGTDELVDHSPRGAMLYDSDPDTKFVHVRQTDVNRDPEEEPQNDSARYESHFRDWGHRWKPLTSFEVTPDYGVFLGLGTNLTDYGFRARPEEYYMEFKGGGTTTFPRFRLEYLGDFYNLVKGAKVSLKARASQIETTNFFDFGNETPYDANLFTTGYYRVHQQFFILEPSIEFPWDGQFHVTFGGTFKNLKSDIASSQFLQLTKPYGSEENMKLANILVGVNFDSRDAGTNSSCGVLLDVQGSYFPTMLDNETRFGKIRGEARTYLTTHVVTEMTLALRAGGEKIWGDKIPFFEAAYIGGEHTIRGYDAERFAGDASAFGNAELRAYLGRFSFLLPVKFGFLIFGDGGRVYLAGQTSNLWHTSYGAGMWFSVIKRDYAMSISLGKSHEKFGLYIMGGFSF